jgi:hypothetical protein
MHLYAGADDAARTTLVTALYCTAPKRLADSRANMKGMPVGKFQRFSQLLFTAASGDAPTLTMLANPV